MKKVVFYGRYSSVMQNEQSIEGQLHVCRQYAESNGLEIIGEYIDRAMTGTSDKRPEFQRMISDSESGGFESVLVYKRPLQEETPPERCQRYLRHGAAFRHARRYPHGGYHRGHGRVLFR